jgi:hypothetical protein
MHDTSRVRRAKFNYLQTLPVLFDISTGAFHLVSSHFAFIIVNPQSDHQSSKLAAQYVPPK